MKTIALACLLLCSPSIKAAEPPSLAAVAALLPTGNDMAHYTDAVQLTAIINALYANLLSDGSLGLGQTTPSISFNWNPSAAVQTILGNMGYSVVTYGADMSHPNGTSYVSAP